MKFSSEEKSIYKIMLFESSELINNPGLFNCILKKIFTLKLSLMKFTMQIAQSSSVKFHSQRL